MITESEAYDRYDEFLDEMYGEIKIGSSIFNPSKILKKWDNTAYNCGFNDFCNGEDIEIEG